MVAAGAGHARHRRSAGLCFSSIFDTALGDIAHDEAGAASGSLSAVQQIAAGIGSAAVTSVYFAGLAPGQVHAMSTSLVVVLGPCLLCPRHPVAASQSRGPRTLSLDPPMG